MRRSGLLAAVLLFCLALPAAAEEPALHGYLVGYLGTLDIADNPGLVHETEKYTIGLGVGLEPANWGPFGFAFDLWGSEHKYDSTIGGPILFGSVDDRMKLTTTAFQFGPTLTTSADFPLRAYATAGLGFYHHKLYVSGSVFGLPASIEDEERSFVPHLGGGVSLQIRHLRLSVDYRTWKVDGSFDEFGVTDVDLDGELWAAGIGFAF